MKNCDASFECSRTWPFPWWGSCPESPSWGQSHHTAEKIPPHFPQRRGLSKNYYKSAYPSWHPSRMSNCCPSWEGRGLSWPPWNPEDGAAPSPWRWRRTASHWDPAWSASRSVPVPAQCPAECARWGRVRGRKCGGDGGRTRGWPRRRSVSSRPKRTAPAVGLVSTWRFLPGPPGRRWRFANSVAFRFGSFGRGRTASIPTGIRWSLWGTGRVWSFRCTPTEWKNSLLFS